MPPPAPPPEATDLPRPARRRRRPPRPRPDHCLNCAAPARGRFCAECGQEIKDHTVALRPLLADLLAEVASWDSKLLRTLGALIARPGFLSNEYNAGRRVPYLSPLKLYLTVSVLFFLLVSWRTPLGGLVAVNPPPGSKHVGLVVGASADPLPTTEAQYRARQRALPPGKRDGPIERRLAPHLIRAGQKPSDFIAALLNDIPRMMFFLLPLFAVSLKLMYLRTRRLYVEHLIFLLHVHAFAFLLLSLLVLAQPWVHRPWPASLAGLVLLVYVLAAMRVVYKQGWPKTVIKFGLLFFGYVSLLSLCIAGTALAALWLL